VKHKHLSVSLWILLVLVLMALGAPQRASAQAKNAVFDDTMDPPSWASSRASATSCSSSSIVFRPTPAHDGSFSIRPRNSAR
jgi:hypothetical protein